MTFLDHVFASTLGQLLTVGVVIVCWAVTSLVKSVIELRDMAIERRICAKKKAQ
jgi:hypothetical protein